MKFVLALFGLLCAVCVCAPQTAYAADLPARLEAAWEAKLPDDSKGYGVALLPDGPANPPILPRDWVEPNMRNTFAVGFDTYNPPTKNYFNADGNIEDKPQREISLHLNGVEVANRFCPVELKGPTGHKARLIVDWVVGGADVTVLVNDKPVYDHYFVPDAIPYRGTFSLGGGADFSRQTARLKGSFAYPQTAPTRVTAFSHALNDGQHHRNTANVTFPQNTTGTGRVICTLTLDKTPAGLDPWDRIANLYLYDDKGQRFEILRYMTPYRRAYQWKADVTDFLPLLTGTKKMELFCETYAAGWEVSVTFDFHKGKLEHVPYKVVNLWNVIARVGEADKPFDKAMSPLSVPYEPGAKQVKVRMNVTGHGQAPNTDNAAEFVELWRKLTVNGATYQNTLWETDSYLNPCRPQGGTWKFSRAGWRPGDLVTPWTVDVTSDIKPNQPLALRYEIEPFVNKTPEDGNPARHIIESQIIYYK